MGKSFLCLIISKERITEQNLRKSYHHCTDKDFPLCPLTLPEIYEIQAKNNNGNGMTWFFTGKRLTYTEMYSKVSTE